MRTLFHLKGLARILEMLLTAYLDESGTHEASPISVMAGYLGTVDQWHAFEADWTALLQTAVFKADGCGHRRSATCNGSKSTGTLQRFMSAGSRTESQPLIPFAAMSSGRCASSSGKHPSHRLYSLANATDHSPRIASIGW